MKKQGWQLRCSAAIRLFLLFQQVLVALGARARALGPCQPACEHGGLCLPRPETGGAQTWNCYCKSPWAGPTCSARTDVLDTNYQGLPVVADVRPALLQDDPDSLSGVHWIRPVLVDSLPGDEPASTSMAPGQRKRFLEDRLHTLVRQFQRAAKQHPENALRLAFFRALCGHTPCPLGLNLQNFHVLGAEGSAVHLGVAPGPGTASLPAILHEVEQQLSFKESPLRRAGGSSLEVGDSQLGLWFPKPTLRPPAPNVHDAIQALAEVGQWQLHTAASFSMLQGIAAVGHWHMNQTNETGPLEGNGTDAAEIAGVKKNTANDLAAFLSAMALNSAIVCFCILLLSLLRRAFPIVYEGKGETCDGSFLGWTWKSYFMDTQEIMDKAGLDPAMLVGFMDLSMWILVVVGVPLLLVMAPLHYWCGGNAAGDDKLSWFSMGNVKQGSWLCWVHAFVVWYVVIATQKVMFRKMRKDFVVKRHQWLKDMPEPRATSVLVEGIPDEQCKTEALRKYFDDGVFGRRVVKHAYFVKETSELQQVIANLARAKEAVEAAEKKNADPARIGKLMRQQRELERSVEDLRQKAVASDDNNARNAFITFDTRRDAAIALKLFGPDDAEEILVSIPPDPSDIIWSDLLVDPNLQAFREMIGWALIVTLIFSFMPVVIYIARIASLDNVKDKVPFFQNLVENYPKLANLWNGLVGSTVLSIMMGLLPTFLVLIVGNLFVLRAQAWLQLHLQSTYFYFLVLYVLLVTAIGSSLIETARYLAQHPMEIFNILADKMPSRTHFYLSYLSVQWGTHALNMLRYVNLFKFLALSTVYEKAQAKEWSEPEDQDYHGMGSRYARNTLFLVIALVFCSLSPLMVVVGWVNFVISRMSYAYLVVYSEGKKADLGGVFWFESLKHVQQGLFLYVALMTGVLMERASNIYPGLISALCFFYCFNEYRYFLREFRWELLEFHELKSEHSKVLPGVSYRQPELIGAFEEEHTDKDPDAQDGPLSNLFQALQSRYHGFTDGLNCARPQQFPQQGPATKQSMESLEERSIEESESQFSGMRQ